MEYSVAEEEGGPLVAGQESRPSIVAAKDHFPMCIVWTPIPLLTWMLPMVGHLGIAKSDGVIHDFIGPYTINKSRTRTGFGPTARYIAVELRDIVRLGDEPTASAAWDSAVERSSAAYEHMMHNLICNNCHSHVAKALNELEYKNFKHWNTLTLLCLLFAQGKFASPLRFAWTFVPFLLGCVGLVVMLSLGYSLL